MRRRDLLAAAAAFGLVPWLPAVAASRARRLVVVHAWGGWDVTFALDPKPREDVDGPYVDEIPADPDDAAAIETFHGIPILADPNRRPAVSTFFAAHGQRCTLINGLHVGAVGHHDGIRRVLTGAAAVGRPDLVALVGAAGDRPLSAVDLSGAGEPGPFVAEIARMGPRGQLRGLLDPGARYPAPADSPVQRPADLPPDTRAAIRRFLDQRLDAHAPGTLVEQRRESLDRARRLQDAGITDALPIGLRTDLTTSVDAALDLLAADAVGAVLLDSGEHWDTHAHQERQHSAYQGLFAGLGRLVGGLVARGMLDVSVLVVAEMARSPHRNAEGGTEHWPTTSALWIDPKQTSGRVVGQTDGQLLATPVDLGTGAPDPSGVVPRYDHLAAAVLAACDVDPEPWLPGVTPYSAATAG